jgi:membrane protein YdbS with pleckstrin-like domain
VGWNWVGQLNKGDFLNYIGIALLALLTVVCYLVLLPGYIRRKDWIYTSFCIAEVVVLLLAASGIFGSGGH